MSDLDQPGQDGPVQDRPEAVPLEPRQPGAGHQETGQPGQEQEPARRRIWVLVAVAVTVLACDIATKVLVVATLSHRSIRLLGGFLTLVVTRNSGAAFSIGTSMTVVFAAIAAGVICFLVFFARQIRSLPWAIALGLLLGGATGNFIDRMLRSPGPFTGNVVDWIQLPHYPIFNVADSAIVCGGILCVLLVARGFAIDGSRTTGQGSPGQGSPGQGSKGG